jgi:ABC-type lipoprotein release transport system permease subunit
MIGSVLGIGGALVLTRIMRGLLFRISPTDPATYIGVPLLWVVVALAASYIPARRAACIDPAHALRVG